MAMGSEFLKVLHIAPHIGWGIGKAVVGLSLLGKKDGIQSAVVLLEQPQKTGIVKEAASQGIPVYIEPEKDVLTELIRHSDIVVVNWWNHPLMYQFLCELNEECRLVIWCHVNGCVYPYFDSGFLLEFEHIFFTTPYSKENMLWSSEHKRQILEKSSVLYGFGSFRPENIACKKNWGEQNILKIGYAGTLSYSKMSPEYIAYCEAVCEACPYAEIHLAGDADERILWDVSHSKYKENLFFDGYITDIQSWYHDMDIFLYLLNPLHYGTTENVILEAMACGLPVIAFAHKAEQMIIGTDGAGIFIKNKEELVKAVSCLCNPQKRKIHGLKARESVCTEYSCESSYRGYSDIIRNIARRSKRIGYFSKILAGGGKNACQWFLMSAGPDKKVFEKYLFSHDAIPVIDLIKRKYIYSESGKSSLIQFHEYYPDDEKLGELYILADEFRQKGGEYLS